MAVLAGVHCSCPREAKLLQRAVLRELRERDLADADRRFLLSVSRQLERMSYRAKVEEWTGWNTDDQP